MQDAQEKAVPAPPPANEGPTVENGIETVGPSPPNTELAAILEASRLQAEAALEAAKAQAEAAIAAAGAQADAMIVAAEQQATATLIAGGLGLVGGLIGAGAVAVAGYFAYRSAISAAQRAAQHDEKRHDDRVKAFKALISDLASSLDAQIADNLVGLKRIKRRLDQAGGGSLNLPINPIELPAEFKPERWEDHALLGEAAIKEILSIRHEHAAYTRLASESKEGLRTDSLTRSKIEEREDGGVDVYAVTGIDEAIFRSESLLKHTRRLLVATM